MKLHELHAWLNVFMKYENNRDLDVVIEIKSNSTTIGPSPSMKVSSVSVGFDWNKGKFIISPENSLVVFDEDVRSKIRLLEEKLGWCEYEKRDLKRQIKKLSETNNNTRKN